MSPKNVYSTYLKKTIIKSELGARLLKSNLIFKSRLTVVYRNKNIEEPENSFSSALVPFFKNDSTIHWAIDYFQFSNGT